MLSLVCTNIKTFFNLKEAFYFGRRDMRIAGVILGLWPQLCHDPVVWRVSTVSSLSLDSLTLRCLIQSNAAQVFVIVPKISSSEMWLSHQ